MTGESAIADELAQEVFLKAFDARPDWSQIKSMRSWLYRIAYRHFLDYKRKRDRRTRLSEAPPDPQPHTTAASGPSGLALDIAAAMEALPTERRSCAMLCLALGYSHADAAEILTLPLGTVKSHVHRAKSQLQDYLKEYADVIAS